MRSETELLEDSAEELFEEAPCGYLTTRLDGTIIRVNRTFELWTGYRRDELLDRVRFQDLLSPGGRIYHETHYAPLLRMQGSVREIAIEIRRPDGSRLPALINSVLRTDAGGRPRLIRTTVFDATDRRRYEQELLRVSRREHEIAQQLQRSLLGGELPASPRLELEILYSPGLAGTEVGGDWYDAFWLAEGSTVGLVVGDVVGRGIGAAATMGQLRSAVRALAGTGLGPADVLSALDVYSHRHRVGQMTTLVYAQLDLDTGTLCFACAGHPPPLLMEPGRPPELAWEGRSLPIDAFSARSPRPQSRRSLARNTRLLLYTDGLIEHRSRPQEDGLARLCDEVARVGVAPPSELVPALAQAMGERGHADDLCVLAAGLPDVQPGCSP